MKPLLGLMLVFSPFVQADDLLVSVAEKKATTKMVFRVDPQTLRCTRTPACQGRALPQIHKYNIVNWRLRAAGRDLTAAGEILYQTTAHGSDLVVLRDEYNSWFGPLNLILALGGHPVQVNQIVLAQITPGKPVARQELLRKAASYDWSATISH